MELSMIIALMRTIYILLKHMLHECVTWWYFLGNIDWQREPSNILLEYDKQCLIHIAILDALYIDNRMDIDKRSWVIFWRGHFHWLDRSSALKQVLWLGGWIYCCCHWFRPSLSSCLLRLHHKRGQTKTIYLSHSFTLTYIPAHYLSRFAHVCSRRIGLVSNNWTTRIYIEPCQPSPLADLRTHPFTGTTGLLRWHGVHHVWKETTRAQVRLQTQG